MPDVKVSLDCLGVLEEAMRHFYLKAVIEKTAGELADWAAVDRAMMQAASLARDLAAWKTSEALGGADCRRVEPGASGRGDAR